MFFDDETDIEKRKIAIWASSAGKSAVADKIAAMFPEHKIYVEPFVGSGAVFFAKKPATSTEVVNDFDPEIAEAFMAVKNMTPEKLKRLEGMDWKSSRAKWHSVKESKPSGELEKFYRFMYLSRFSYGSMRGKSWDTGSEGMEYSTVARRVERHMDRCKGLHVYSGDYERVVRKYDGPDTLFFFDPPYFGYDAAVREKQFDEQKFYDLLKSLKGKWLVTYGIRGELPGLLKKGGYKVHTFKTYRSIGHMRGVGGEKALAQIWAANYPVTAGAAGLSKSERRSLRLSDPERIVGRLTCGQPAGVLSAFDRDTLTDQELIVTNDIQKSGAGARAYGVAILKSGVRFESGAKAVSALGEKVDEYTASVFKDVEDPVWFHPLRLKTRFDPPRQINTDKGGQPAAQAPQEFDNKDAFLKSFDSADVLHGGVAVEPMITGVKILVAREKDGKAFVSFDGKTESSTSFPKIAKAVGQLKEPCIFVGLAVNQDASGNPQPTTRADDSAMVFVVDALLWGSEDLTKKTWLERKAVRDRALGQRGVGALANTPARIVHGRDELAGALTWASKHPASVGAVGKQATGQYVHGGKMASLRMTRTVNAVVVSSEKKDGGNVYRCAVGPLGKDEENLWKNTVDVGGSKFSEIGMTAPTKIEAQNGDTLRVDVRELQIIDSDRERAITWVSPIVAERVKIRPDSPSAVRSKANEHEIIRKSEVRILKADDDEHYVLGIVLEPNDGKEGAPLDPDAHQDVYSTQDVADAGRSFLAQHNQLGVMHKRIAKRAEMVVCENYIAPVDFEYEGQQIRKGSWLLGAYILSDDLWSQVKSGKLNAWSIQGRAMSRPEVVRE